MFIIVTTTPTDSNNDNERHENINGDSDYMKKGKDHNINTTNNKCWKALGVLLVGIIVIAGCCELKVVYEGICVSVISKHYYIFC